MNLHSIVSGAISAVNPFQNVTIQISTGYATNPDGSRTPTYAPPVAVSVNIEALQYNDILQSDSLNIQGVRRKVYLNGDIDGLVRAENKGGDLLTFPDGSVWKVAFVAEQWADWVCAILTLQDNA